MNTPNLDKLLERAKVADLTEREAILYQRMSFNHFEALVPFVKFCADVSNPRHIRDAADQLLAQIESQAGDA